MLLDFVWFFLAIISSPLDNNRWLTIGLFEISAQQTHNFCILCRVQCSYSRSRSFLWSSFAKALLFPAFRHSDACEKRRDTS